MSQQNLLKIDGILWWIWQDTDNIRHVQPVCPEHRLRMYPAKHAHMDYDFQAVRLKCEECNGYNSLPRSYSKQERYILDKLDSRIFTKLKTLNLDDEIIPLAQDTAKTKDEKYFINTALMKTKNGPKIILTAGKKGSPVKTKLSIDPKMKKIITDPKSSHPAEIFCKFEATFADGYKMLQKKKK